MNRQERRELRDRLQARFEQLHHDEGWTQQMLAEESGLSLRTVSDALRSVSVPNMATLGPMARALGVAIDEATERAKWPEDVQTHLMFIGMVLSHRSAQERQRLMEDIAKVLMT